MPWQRRKASRRVLHVLAATPAGEMSITRLSDRTGIGPARIHALLVRLRKQGLVVSRWSRPHEPDTRLCGQLLYRASAYGLWVARGQGKGPPPVARRPPEYDQRLP
ncbi:MarR family transcriptional regulator [Saccharothrix saharensis]|uniref:MarR family transcriptional regulator n=1 Tax=Saccharothrix saharensis TaxID=571190 RepID=UPI0036CD68E1